MIVENSVRRTHHGLAVARRIPCQADPRLEVVLVSLNSFLQPKVVVAEGRQPGRRLELGRDFYVVAQAKVECQIRPGAPRILPERPDRDVLEGVAWAAQALYKDRGQ